MQIYGGDRTVVYRQLTPSEKEVKTFFAVVPEGMRSLVLAEIADYVYTHSQSVLLHIAKSQLEADNIKEQLSFYAPQHQVISIPEWDCLPYDRISPSREVMAQRIEGLSKLSHLLLKGTQTSTIVITTINNLLQRLPVKEFIGHLTCTLQQKQQINIQEFLNQLHDWGFMRLETVTQPGEYAVRGSIIDFFPPGQLNPVRLDLDDIIIDHIRIFDPITQRTIAEIKDITLKPAGEIFLNSGSIENFRTTYRQIFQVTGNNDPLYEAISNKRPYAGMEHWLPLFYSTMATIFDYLTKNCLMIFDSQTLDLAKSRLTTITDYYQARSQPVRWQGQTVYHPLPPNYLYLAEEELEPLSDNFLKLCFTPFTKVSAENSIAKNNHLPDFGQNNLLSWLKAKVGIDYNILTQYIHEQRNKGKRILIAGYTLGSVHRLELMLKEHGFVEVAQINHWDDLVKLPEKFIAITQLPIEKGFLTENLCVLSEQDILGERIVRPSVARKRKTQDLLLTLSRFSIGDFLVHQEYGIGRYEGMEIVHVGNAPHDCVKLMYDGNDKLFVPVENIDLLSRHSSGDLPVSLDKLGGVSWQNRKAKIRNLIQDIADDLIKTAAAREIKEGHEIVADNTYQEFTKRFPYVETDDQEKAIADVLADLARGHPMDRLICGDVGFGKTEIALRAAFVAASKGFQVAVLTPTTLLCRQHYETFQRRFAGFPFHIAMLSRFNKANEAIEIEKRAEEGKIDILIGTHALLAESMRFKNLGLLIVDEEQHFGVVQKEKIKKIQEDVHILTLTATPIPRTLQMSMADIKQMSLIATPPIDRLPVKTLITPYDPIVLREAMLQEFYRGGQIFYVCPRIEDLEEVSEELAELMPELKHIVIHGQMRTSELEKAMMAFYDRSYQLLLSTNIIESGLDIPSANTIIIHRADMFGLAQLYQLRGRVGRSKVRGYAYLTVKPNQQVTPAAQKRLEVMQSLETLGSGFTLASYDLDIRGSGNLIGSEQSGHIREVGIELYQQMLAEAVERGKKGAKDKKMIPDNGQPQINLGVAVLIPEIYVQDLGIRLDLYRRIASLASKEEIEAFAVELEDRFGAIPQELENLFTVITLKRSCKILGIKKVDVGQKGIVLLFYPEAIKNPQPLVSLVSQYPGQFSLKPDNRFIYHTVIDKDQQRIQKTKKLLEQLQTLSLV